MGRVKLEIKKIENTNNRLITFAKRKAGLIKKAQELATLCDIDVALIMFSPGNKLTQYATNSRIEEIITRYANVPEAERFKRKMENLQQLNRAIRKLKGEEPSFNPPFKGEFSMEYVQKERNKLQNEIENAQTRLRLYQGDDEALDLLNYEELSQMELHVQAIMEKVHGRKQEMLIVDYNMKEAWLQQKDADLSNMIKVFKEHSSESPDLYLDQVPYHILNPSLDLNQQAGGSSDDGAAGFVRFGNHPALTQPEPFFMESIGLSIVHDNAENYPPFQLLESEFDCPPAETQMESSSK